MTTNQLRAKLAEKLEGRENEQWIVLGDGVHVVRDNETFTTVASCNEDAEIIALANPTNLRRILTAMEGMEQALWMIKRMSDVDNGNGFNRVAREALAALDLDDDAKEPAK
jgi:hypothetical protein